jgi:CubicO group peptidase (beta-lactamase class C family)
MAKMKSLTASIVLSMLLSISGQAVALTTPAIELSLQAAPRDQLTFEELMRAEYSGGSPIDNRYFMPVGESAPAFHAFQGTLTVPQMVMEKSTSRYNAYRYFPGFSVDFFTYEGYLAPATRTLIVSPGNWSLILSPGKVWSEPGDNGMSRASFPFTLGSPPDRLTAGGEAHNGVATFLFDDTHVSSFRFQITQETAPDGDIFDMWGQYPMEYIPGPIENQETLAAEFAEELARQMPIHPWVELQSRYDPDILASFTAGLPPEETSAAGVVIDGVIYLQPSLTRYGEYPYPRYMHHGAMSISKSIGAGIAMLWLAQKYGEDVFELKIVDYLDVSAKHDGWNEVTFGDVLNMASGVGDNAPYRRPFDPYANEMGSNYRGFVLADSTAEKLPFAFASDNYPWGPGEILRYTSAQTFVLSAAMDAFLKSKEGPDAHLWEMLSAEVFRPIGVYHMTIIHVPNGFDNPGIPLMASGLRVTVDDVGKIVTLLQNGGQHNGKQLLSAAKLAEALYRTGQVIGLPSGKTFAYGDQAYHMSFWSIAHRTRDGRYFQVPFMSGAGGNTIFIAPNGVSTFVFTDFGKDSYSLNSPFVAESIRPYPGEGIRHGLLVANKGIVLIPESRRQTQVNHYLLLSWFVLTVGSIGFLLLDMARSTPTPRRSRLVWVLVTTLFGPFGLVAYLVFYKRSQHASIHEAKRMN